MTTCVIRVTHFISMLTALLSARLLRASTHFRTWSQLASWEPVSEKACFSVPSAAEWEDGLYLPAVSTGDQGGGTECGKSPTPPQMVFSAPHVGLQSPVLPLVSSDSRVFNTIFCFEKKSSFNTLTGCAVLYFCFHTLSLLPLEVALIWLFCFLRDLGPRGSQ